MSMKILVVRFSSIGDIVLTTPVLRCLRHQLPDAQIHYLTKAQFAPLLSANPHIDRLHLLDDDLEKVLPALKLERFDFIVDLHRNLRTTRVKRALDDVKSAAFPKKNFEKWVAVNFRVNLMPDASIVERYFEAVKPLGVHNDGGGLECYIGTFQNYRSGHSHRFCHGKDTGFRETGLPGQSRVPGPGRYQAHREASVSQRQPVGNIGHPSHDHGEE